MRFFAEFILERSEGLRMIAAVSFEHLIFGSFDPFDYAQGRLCSGQVLILFRISIRLLEAYVSIFEFRVYGKMPKDLKIGMLLGMVLVTVAMLWLSTGPGLSPKAAGPNPRSNPPPREGPARSNNFSTNDLTTQSAEDNQSKSPDSTIYEQAEKIKTQKFHIIRQGETLSEISHKYYGSANKWRMILDANRDVVKDANKLRPGTKLIIPE